MLLFQVICNPAIWHWISACVTSIESRVDSDFQQLDVLFCNGHVITLYLSKNTTAIFNVCHVYGVRAGVGLRHVGTDAATFSRSIILFLSPTSWQLGTGSPNAAGNYTFKRLKRNSCPVGFINSLLTWQLVDKLSNKQSSGSAILVELWCNRLNTFGHD